MLHRHHFRMSATVHTTEMFQFFCIFEGNNLNLQEQRLEIIKFQKYITV